MGRMLNSFPAIHNLGDTAQPYILKLGSSASATNGIKRPNVATIYPSQSTGTVFVRHVVGAMAQFGSCKV